MAAAVLALVALALAALAHASRLPLAVFSHGPRAQHRDLLQLTDEELALDQYAHLADKLNDPEALAGLRVLYQVGNSEASLPECGERAVCTKLDLYGQPWLERQCRCKHGKKCPGPLTTFDGHTIIDKTRHYKLCEPVRRLPQCAYFRDVTWTLLVSGLEAGNGNGNASSEHVVHCRCPAGAVAYLIKRQAFRLPNGAHGSRYSFACSPQSRLRCKRKEPCRLFTVRPRHDAPQLDEVNTSTLCQCPRSYHCPRHHHDPGVVLGKAFLEEAVKTYSGYCTVT